MRDNTDQPGTDPPSHADGDRMRRPYHRPTLHRYGSVRELTLTLAAGPNFDGGGGANIYSS